MTQVSERSAFTFSSLIEPLSAREFERGFAGRREWFRRGRAERFDGLLSWRTLNELIRDQRPSGPRFRLMKAASVVPEAAYHRTVQTLRGPLRMIDPAGLLAEVRDGATLVWDAIDQAHPPIRAAKQEVERALRAFVFVNMYASWGGVGGLGGHWDDHDVFVIQLIGRKNWRVQPPARSCPLPEDAGLEPPTRYANDWTLDPGSVLYLPRGWWHRVTPVGEPSLHLTIGVLRPTNADFLRWLVEQVTESDLVRQDFPFPMDEQARVAHAAALRSVLGEWLRPSAIELYERMQDETHYLDPRPTLQAADGTRAWDPDSEVLLLSTRADLRRRDGDVALVVAGEEWRAPGEAEPSLRSLVDGRPVRVDVLLRHVPDSFLSGLVTAGIVAVT
jgi:ribosomal protein L16 Arg81 hydroxylase